MASGYQTGVHRPEKGGETHPGKGRGCALKQLEELLGGKKTASPKVKNSVEERYRT